MESTVHLNHPETFYHAHTIAHLCSLYRPKLFVEYGVCNGNTTTAIAPHCEMIWGVDNGDLNDPHDLDNVLQNYEAFKMNTNEFDKILQERNPVIDMAFIDADHKWISAFRDFEALWPYIRNNGIIFLHDTYPMNEFFLQPNKCNDCFKTPEKVWEKYHNECEMLTLPINPGLTMVRKKCYLPHMVFD
jgi:predicted O-methyltransferase YrrM